MSVQLEQKPAFKRVYKKLHPNQRLVVHAAIRAIVADPGIGEAKKGDLARVFVYKFDCIHQQFLLAYQWDETRRMFMAVGPHENFYRNLKL
ncbi:addiction module toxin RelE [Thiocystis minor]|uniref:type II toxin-antitoxin system RelE/ParE family toxin n=1 Tax=Thiocystis minor TaxID=61597 RepID=UPI00191410F1|nr:type II toxin-antitoxin system RelE/ParE family toxin [Thiocystis minor]MBK5964123.1 addiction module toxin RelE [Thiocystis minor]